MKYWIITALVTWLGIGGYIHIESLPEPIEPKGGIVTTFNIEPTTEPVNGLKTETKAIEQDTRSIIERNPNNCDLDKQIMWQDGSCHDKPVASSNTTHGAVATGKPSSDCYASELSKYDWDVATMQRIMRAESGCNPTNHNYADQHATCSGSYGLLQIGCVHGYSAEYLSNPANNIKAAYAVYQSQGYNAWSVY